MARLRTISQAIAKPAASRIKTPPKQADSYYHTAEWQALRKACLERDRYRCQIALHGCQGMATIADHIISRRAGGDDKLSNLRAACPSCDARVKEDHLGRRRGRGI